MFVFPTAACYLSVPLVCCLSVTWPGWPQEKGMLDKPLTLEQSCQLHDETVEDSGELVTSNLIMYYCAAVASKWISVTALIGIVSAVSVISCLWKHLIWCFWSDWSSNSDLFGIQVDSQSQHSSNRTVTLKVHWRNITVATALVPKMETTKEKHGLNVSVQN